MYKDLQRTYTAIVLLIIPLFGDVLVAVVVVVCLSSLIAGRQRDIRHLKQQTFSLTTAR